MKKRGLLVIAFVATTVNTLQGMDATTKIATINEKIAQIKTQIFDINDSIDGISSDIKITRDPNLKQIVEKHTVAHDEDGVFVTEKNATSPEIISKQSELDAMYENVKQGKPVNEERFNQLQAELTVSGKEQHTHPLIKRQGNNKLVQIPALSQKESFDEHSNYCGYYALYNAICLSKLTQEQITRLSTNAVSTATFDQIKEEILSREAFIKNFKKWISKKKGNKPKFDMLATDEIRALSKIIHTLINKNFGVLDRLEELPEEFQDENYKKDYRENYKDIFEQIEKIKTSQNKHITLIINTSTRGSHWLAIRLDNIDSKKIITIADSIGHDRIQDPTTSEIVHKILAQIA